MKEPSLGLNTAVLEAFLHANLKSGSPILDTWMRLVSRLREAEAEILPVSLERVLPALVGDRERLLLAADIAVSFDLYEMAPALVSLALRTEDSRIGLVAASLSSHPGVSPLVKESVTDLPSRIPFSDAERRAFLVRLDPSAPAGGSLENRLRHQIWPGLATRQDLGLAPLVAVDDVGAKARLRWFVAAQLIQAGAVIRRIPSTWSTKPHSTWLGPQTPVVTWAYDVVSRLAQHGMPLSDRMLVGAPLRQDRIPQLLHHLNPLLGNRLKLESMAPREVVEAVLSPDLLRIGALDHKEMAYLGGGRLHVLYRLARQGLLRPRYVLTRPAWSFAQLVAFRAWRFALARTGRARFSGSLVGDLENLAKAESSTEVGITGDGRLLHKHGDGWADYHSGQRVLESVVFLMDEVFEPFTIGGGSVPNLPRPSPLTSVNPGVLGGTPVVREHRIAARSIAEIAALQGEPSVRTAYPFLDDASIAEGILVGDQVLTQA